MDPAASQQRSTTGERVCALILSFFLPPLGVLLLRGCCVDFLINVLLTLLLPWFGGMLHAVWIAVRDVDRSPTAGAGAAPPTLPVAQPPYPQQPPPQQAYYAPPNIVVPGGGAAAGVGPGTAPGYPVGQAPPPPAGGYPAPPPEGARTAAGFAGAPFKA